MNMRTFRSPEDFRKSLESKLIKQSKELNQDLERIRRKVAFERLLARLFSSNSHMWLLKGGYAMELRFQTARATQDVDLMLREFSEFINGSDRQRRLREALAEAASLSLPDYFQFQIGEEKKKLEGPLYGGARFSVESRIGGRRFVRFNLDLALGDFSLEPIDQLQVDSWLSEYGLPPVEYCMVNSEQQFAEKLHAYTHIIENRINTRVKDLIDMVLLIDGKKLDKACLNNGIQRVFARRKTHQIPNVIPKPPEQWKLKFEALAQECKVKMSLNDAYDKLNNFIEECKAI